MDFIQQLLLNIQQNGEWKEPAREGMPRTKSIFSRELRFNLQEGFPAVTTKELYWKGVVAELIWFLRGDTNIKYLIENGVHIWDKDAYKFYKKMGGALSQKDWMQCIIDDPGKSYLHKLETDIHKNYEYGACGNIYGYQWRDWEQKHRDVGFDQLANLLDSIEGNPNSRYHIVTAWQPTDFLRDQEAALPACHMMFHVYIREGKYLDLKMVQRSCDTFLGVPFNIASYALLTHILANLTGYEPGEFIWSGNDIHYYENQQEAVEEILTRQSFDSPKLVYSLDYTRLCEDYRRNKIDLDGFISELKPSDFILFNYQCHPKLKAPLSVGI